MTMKKELNNQEVMNNKEALDIKEQQDQQEQQDQPKEQRIEMDTNQLKDWLVTEEGKRFIQPILDRHFSKGLKTWQENNLEKMIEAEIEKRYPTDPKEQEILRLQKELQVKEINEVAVNTLAEHQLSPSLARFFIGESVEDTKAGLEEFIKTFKQTVNKEITERLKSFGSVPRTGEKFIPSMTKDELMNLNYEQRVKFFHENPDEYHRIMNS